MLTRDIREARTDFREHVRWTVCYLTVTLFEELSLLACYTVSTAESLLTVLEVLRFSTKTSIFDDTAVKTSHLAFECSMRRHRKVYSVYMVYVPPALTFEHFIFLPQYIYALCMAVHANGDCFTKRHEPNDFSNEQVASCVRKELILRKATVSFVISLCLAVPVKNSTPSGRILMKFDSYAFFFFF
jgi:hypothetical protein